MLANISDYRPYSEEIDLHGGAIRPLESGRKLFIVVLVEAISKTDLFIIVPWQQTDLVSGKVGHGIKFRLVLLGPVLDWGILPC